MWCWKLTENKIVVGGEKREGAYVHFTFALLTSAVSRKVHCVSHVLMRLYTCPHLFDTLNKSKIKCGNAHQTLLRNTASDQKFHMISLIFIHV